MPICEPTTGDLRRLTRVPRISQGLEGGQLIGLIQIIRIKEATIAAQDGTPDLQKARARHTSRMHMCRQMGRELRDYRAYRSQRLGNVRWRSAAANLNPPFWRLHPLQVCRKHSIYRRYGALNLEILRILADNRKPRGKKRRGHLRHIRTAGSELRLKLRRV